MSLFKLLRGETYIAYILFSNLFSLANLTNSFIIERKAAKVFPLPVGEEISMFFFW
jgi:hypothetical protein